MYPLGLLIIILSKNKMINVILLMIILIPSCDILSLFVFVSDNFCSVLMLYLFLYAIV